MDITVIIVGVLFIVPGLLGFFFPEPMLKFGNRWRYRDPTPTDEAVLVAKIASLIVIGVGLALIFLGIFWDDALLSMIP